MMIKLSYFVVLIGFIFFCVVIFILVVLLNVDIEVCFNVLE